MIKATHGILNSGGVSYDADAVTYFAANTDCNTTSMKSKVNQLVLDLKTNSLWSKFITLYPFKNAGGTAFGNKWNLINPVDSDAAYRFTFSGGFTHTSGLQGNGTNNVANNHFSTSKFVGSGGCFGHYSSTNNGGAYYDFGTVNSASTNEVSLITRWSDDKFYINCNSKTYPNIANTNSIGFYVWNCKSSGTVNGYKNGSKVITESKTLSKTTDELLFTCERFNTGTPGNFSPRNYYIMFECEELTDSEITTLNTIVSTFIS